jgi:hypothetical protein
MAKDLCQSVQSVYVRYSYQIIRGSFYIMLGFQIIRVNFYIMLCLGI